MSDTTLQTPPAYGDGGGRAAPAPRTSAPQSLIRRATWWLVALAVVVVAVLMIVIGRTRPGYDPYGWLDWGYQTWHGSLNLGGAPSWKPFTYLFNVPYALTGHYALWLWMVTAISVSLAGAVFGGRIAYNLTAREGGPRYAPILAAVFAGACVLGIQQYFHYLLSDQSDSMLVTVCLAAIDMALIGRCRWAWCLGILAGLGRPEVWPFAGLYGLWCWRKLPSMRWMLYAGIVITAFLWFGIPTITNGRPDVAGQLALRSPRELHSNKVLGTINRFLALEYAAVEIAALVAVGLALLRRNWTVVLLGVIAAGWVIVEIAFVLHGFPGVPRYLFEPAGLTAVLAGVAVGWLALDASRWHPSLPRWAGLPLVVVLFAVMVPQAISAMRWEHHDIRHEQARTVQINKLAAFINSLGGNKAILACGHPVVNVEYVSIMGWYTHRNTGTIGYRPLIELHDRRYPILMFTPLPNGWAVKPYRQHSASCQAMNALFVPTARHPGGVLVRK